MSRTGICAACSQTITDAGHATIILCRGQTSPWGFTYETHHCCDDCGDLLRTFLGQLPKRPPPPPPEPLPEPPFGCHDERLSLDPG